MADHIDPGKIPYVTVFDGFGQVWPGPCDPDGVSSGCRGLLAAGEGVENGGRDVLAAWAGIQTCYAGPSQQLIWSGMAPVGPRTSSVCSDMVEVSSALGMFADAVAPVLAALRQVQRDAYKLVADIDAFVPHWSATNPAGPIAWYRQVVSGFENPFGYWIASWDQEADLVARNEALESQVSAQVVLFQDAERTCANSIDALVGGGTQYRPWQPSDGAAPGSDVYGWDADTAPTSGLPWGDPVTQQESCATNTVNFVPHVIGGVLTDAANMVVSVNTIVEPWSLPGLLLGAFGYGPTWKDSLQSLEGLADLVAALGPVGSSGLPIAVYDFDTGQMSFTTGRQVLLAVGKGMIDWDDWSTDPGKALGESIFNIGSLVAMIPTGGGSLAADVADVADVASDAAKGAELAEAAETAGTAGTAGAAFGAVRAGETAEAEAGAAEAMARDAEAAAAGNMTREAGAAVQAARELEDTARTAGVPDAAPRLDTPRLDTPTGATDTAQGAADAARAADTPKTASLAHGATDTAETAANAGHTPAAAQHSADTANASGDAARAVDDTPKGEPDARDITHNSVDNLTPTQLANRDAIENALHAPGVDPQQAAAIQKVLDDPSLLDSTAVKGNFMEMVGDVKMESEGWTRLGPNRVTSLDQAGHDGIDAVYYKPGDPPQYQIVDQKYSTSGSQNLKVTVSSGPQMGTQWISDRLEDYFTDPDTGTISDASQSSLRDLQDYYANVAGPGGATLPADVSAHLQIMNGKWDITDLTIDKVVQRGSTMKATAVGSRQTMIWGEP